MSETVLKPLKAYLSAERMTEVQSWVAKYPPEQRCSAVMSTLRIVQEEHGYLTPVLMDAVAVYLDMPKIAVYEVASFYTMYESAPTGRHIINVCTNISCQLNGSQQIVSQLENSLGVKVGETTEDGRFTLRAVECLAACVNAPVMQVDKTYHENLTPKTVNAILEGYS